MDDYLSYVLILCTLQHNSTIQKADFPWVRKPAYNHSSDFFAVVGIVQISAFQTVIELSPVQDFLICSELKNFSFGIKVVFGANHWYIRVFQNLVFDESPHFGLLLSH